MSASRLYLGRNAVTGRRLFLDEEQRQTHLFMPGRSGMGKSTHLEHLIRQDIRAGRGLCLVDPDGALFDNVVTYCALRKSTWDRVLIIDPNEDEYRVGLNYFDIPGLSAQRRIDLFIEACYKVLGQSEKETKVLFERWGDAAAKLLVLYPPGPLTMAELYPALVDEEFRSALLAQAPQAHRAVEEWRHFELDIRSQRDKNMHLLAALDRALKLVRDARMEEILGQPNSIDWREAMDSGKIVLVNLHDTHGEVTPSLSRMLGVIVIHQIMEAAKQRPVRPAPRPFYVYVDEFSEVVTEDFRVALKRLRKRGTPFTLAQQELADLLIEDEGKLYASVLNNVSTTVAFGMRDYEEAQKLGRHMFATEVTGMKVKWKGPPTTQAIPHSRSEEVDVVSEAHADSRSDSDASGGSEATTFNAELDELVTAKGLSFGSGHGRAAADSVSVSHVTQRWTEYEYEQIEQAPQFKTIEEEFHEHAAAVMRLGRGEAFLSYDPSKPTLPIRTPVPGSKEFRELWASGGLIAEFKAAVYRNMGLRRPQDVRALIEQRRSEVLLGAAVVPDPVTESFDQASTAEIVDEAGDASRAGQKVAPPRPKPPKKHSTRRP